MLTTGEAVNATGGVYSKMSVLPLQVSCEPEVA